MLLSSVSKRKRAAGDLFSHSCDLSPDEYICKVRRLTKPLGNYLFWGINSANEELTISIPPKYRNTFYFVPGHYVVVKSLEGSKVKGEITTLLLEKQITQMCSDGTW
ncbi:unnamed protein product [Protopolystoma xenopodis]|uniref:Uncharacterized protein n=1 Tax=Protopolystoma xenopodis TaxID=117903 RepID=A0A3S5AUI5_9PLAT|nr:unnamed protein product [Protopolystoma xenopodis]